MTQIKNELQSLLERSLRPGKKIPGAIIAACSSDNSFSWTGVCGKLGLNSDKPVTRDTPFFIASATKMLTAACLFRLIDRESLSLEDKITPLLPDTLSTLLREHCGAETAEKLTIRHLISHTSGIADYYGSKPSDGLSFLEMACEEPENSWTPIDTINFALSRLKAISAPGEKSAYSDTNFQILGVLLEIIENRPLEEIFTTEIFEPLRMNHSWLSNRSTPLKLTPEPVHPFMDNTDLSQLKALDSAWADGGVVSSAEDCLKFIRHYTGGKLFNPKHLKEIYSWKRIFPFVQYGLGTMRIKILLPLRPIFGFSGFIGHTGSTATFILKTIGYDLYLAGCFNQSRYTRMQLNTVGKIASKIIRNGNIPKTPNSCNNAIYL